MRMGEAYRPVMAALAQADATAEELLAFANSGRVNGSRFTIDEIRNILRKSVNTNKVHVVDHIKRCNTRVRVYKLGPKPETVHAQPCATTLPGILRLCLPVNIPHGRVVRKLAR